MIYDGLELGNMVLGELVLGRVWRGDLERGIALAGGFESQLIFTFCVFCVKVECWIP